MNSENFIKFVKYFNAFEWLKENRPEATVSTYGFEGYQDDKAKRFRDNIRLGIEKSKIFEVPDDIKKLLCLTDTPNKNEEVHLPFPVVFIDVHFTKEELAELGIDIEAPEMIGIMFREGILISHKEEVVGKDLNITMLSGQTNGETWFDNFNKNWNINKEFKDHKCEILENPTTDKKAREFIHKFTLNFLNFLNNPEVEYVEHIRSAKNRERRAKNGKAIIPSTFTIRVTGKLREYIDEAVAGEHWNYNYRFWVRGHFRDLVSERYTQKKRIWILPFIKGKGVLVEKSYTLKNTGETK